MSSDKVVLMPAISYTVANAKKDIGNLEINLSNYVKKETLEIIIESLVSDEELAEKLKDYVNKVFMNNALDDYVTKVLLNEKINNFTTYAYVQDVIDNVSTITDQMLAIETTLTNKSDVGHTHTTGEINDLETLIETKINEAKETIINEAFKEIYPIGSIYVSTSLLSEDVKYDYNLSQYYVLWHGCKWKFMDQEFFLRNSTFNVEYGRDETISFIGVGDTGYVSVTDSYTNSYPYLSVCMYQRIA